MMSRMTLVTPPTWGPPHNPLAGPSNWIPPGPGMIGGDYDLFPNFPGRKFIVNQLTQVPYPLTVYKFGLSECNRVKVPK